jgi:tetratricopeptide (TPR) repeat protein
MTGSIKVQTCPQCGAPAKPGLGKCEYCQAQFLVTSLTDLERFDNAGVKKYITHYQQLLKDSADDAQLNSAMGICYLDLRLYDLAAKYFARAIEQMPNSGDVYYNYALALFRGRRPKVLTLTEIKKIEEYLNAAIQVDSSKAKYYYLWALIKHDFYVKNGLRITPPTFQELIYEAHSKSFEKSEIKKMLQHVPIDDRYLTDLVWRR